MGSIPIIGPILIFGGWLICKAVDVVTTIPPQAVQQGLVAFKAILNSAGIPCE